MITSLTSVKKKDLIHDDTTNNLYLHSKLGGNNGGSCDNTLNGTFLRIDGSANVINLEMIVYDRVVCDNASSNMHPGLSFESPPISKFGSGCDQREDRDGISFVVENDTKRNVNKPKIEKFPKCQVMGFNLSDLVDNAHNYVPKNKILT
jgi:hypothetical protein